MQSARLPGARGDLRRGSQMLPPPPTLDLRRNAQLSGRPGRGIGRSPRAETTLPTRPPATATTTALLPPIGLDLVPELLRRRGVAIALKRLQEVAAGGVIPAQRVSGRYVVAEADLGAIEAYFRANPRGTTRGGAAALARAGRR